MGRTNRTISAVLLAVIVGLPVSGSVCAVVCARAAQMASHHHAHATSEASANCHESSTAGPSVTAAGHDCSTHDGMLREAVASLTAVRGDVNVNSIDMDLAPTVSAALSLTSLHPRWRGSPPSLISPSASRSLVLRI